MTNLVTCCRACNEFLNQFALVLDVPATLDEFYNLRDRCFDEKKAAAHQRHERKREWYERWRGEQS